MIVSHQHKFIFIKPTKVAGTSFEIVLAQHCSQDDIIPPISEYSNLHDDDFYNQPIRNYRSGFFNHMIPVKIRNKVGDDIWRRYFKFTIVRNPWDYMVSRYWWNKTKEIDPESYSHADFERFVNEIEPAFLNERFYFMPSGEPAADYYLRYENLQHDYRAVCNKIGLTVSPLPRTKTKTRKLKKHYSLYYNDHTREIVGDLCNKEITHFNYEFEKVE